MILGIETSDLLCSVAYIKDDRILAEYSHELPKQHAALVGSLVENAGKFLAVNKLTALNFMEDLKLVAVSIGPGSFTGLRIGLSYAQGLCLGKQIPLVGISNHQVLADNCPDGHKNVFTLIDARQGEVYLATMIRNHTFFKIKDHRIVDKNNLVNEIDKNAVLICSDKVCLSESIKYELIKKHIQLITSARYAAALTAKIGWRKYQDTGADNLADLEPLYIRSFAGIR
ncbi:MAG: tRNA (adenosine(37)-N6)-threonylcarbamoyltransferase complex dimerization subunit type 1 TsaB [Calditrichaceae bacterium]|nr:tRNA (adenosine(37)-N6)-threonylcarbamoyltransferase complex dimerization subunit type 1 TsaB [Calditrichaceae bacterium]HES60147.1 tRNA (adenosine(37)-N6)-threonylcarbamoyltransferase complex dimerization subunit type 1 TsaB [Caldithrix sp.]